MKARSCRVCGGAIGPGESNCPHCGTLVGTGVSRVWVLTFFVMGVALGLMLLILQQQWLPDGEAVDTAQPAPVKGPAKTAKPAPPRTLTAKRNPNPNPNPKPNPKPNPNPNPNPTLSPPPQPVTENTTIEPINCDRRAAEAVRDKARTLSSITQQGDTVQLTLTRQWEYYSAGHRQSFVETFAEADRCLYGRPRMIRFSYRGEEVARVSVEGAVVMK